MSLVSALRLPPKDRRTLGPRDQPGRATSRAGTTLLDVEPGGILAALSAAERDLLLVAVRRRAPHLEVLASEPVSELSSDDFNDLRDAVGSEMIITGDVGDDVTPRGWALEHLIDRLGPWHWGKDDA